MAAIGPPQHFPRCSEGLASNPDGYYRSHYPSGAPRALHRCDILSQSFPTHQDLFRLPEQTLSGGGGHISVDGTCSTWNTDRTPSKKEVFHVEHNYHHLLSQPSSSLSKGRQKTSYGLLGMCRT